MDCREWLGAMAQQKLFIFGFLFFVLYAQSFFWIHPGVSSIQSLAPTGHSTQPILGFVVLSTGCAPLYSFFLPLAALVWKKRVQFEPIILLVQDVPTTTRTWGSDHPTTVIMHWLKQWGFRDNVYFLHFNASLPDNNVAISQVVRMFVSGMCGLQGPIATAINSNAFIITTDVDIMPIARAQFWLPSSNSSLGKITNSHCCPHQTVQGATFREFPMSTLAFRASTWRQFMQQQCSCQGAADCQQGSILARLNTLLQITFNYGTPQQTPTQWNMDQRLVSLQLHRSPGVLNQTELLERDTLKDRVDRLFWPNGNWSQAMLARYNDAHMLRPGYTNQHWPALRTFFRAVLDIGGADDALLNEIETYVSQYQEAVASSPLQYMLIREDKKASHG